MTINAATATPCAILMDLTKDMINSAVKKSATQGFTHFLESQAVQIAYPVVMIATTAGLLINQIYKRCVVDKKIDIDLDEEKLLADFEKPQFKKSESLSIGDSVLISIFMTTFYGINLFLGIIGATDSSNDLQNQGNKLLSILTRLNASNTCQEFGIKSFEYRFSGDIDSYSKAFNNVVSINALGSGLLKMMAAALVLFSMGILTGKEQESGNGSKKISKLYCTVVVVNVVIFALGLFEAIMSNYVNAGQNLENGWKNLSQ